MIQITEKEFHQLADFIKENYGINLKKEKTTLITGRLTSTILDLGFSGFSEYYKYLQTDKTGKGLETLLNKITTNHTYFMREPEHFRFLREMVLPYYRKTIRNGDLRTWSAGCSSGEEPYTLAMIYNDYFALDNGAWNYDILATDISTNVLGKAVRGIYTEDQVQLVPPAWIKKYFKPVAGGHEVQERIKNQIIFRKFNLMNTSFPFKKKFHIIFCRNVMIYFDTADKNQLVQRFADSLEPGGFLFIGHSESLGRDNASLKYLQPAVYRKE